MSFFESWRSARRAEREAYLRTLQTLVEIQAKSLEGVLNAVNAITTTQAKQAETIAAHLALFKTTEPPSAQALTGPEENRAWAEQQGFPFDGTPEEQARWIEAHDIDD